MVVLGAAFMTSSSHLAAAEQASGSANGLKEASLLAQRDSLDRALPRDEVLDRRNTLLNQRLQLVEELWESVILRECGQPLVDLLRRLRSLCSPEGQALEYPIPEVFQIVENLSLEEAIQAARAFALFFQLINIVEQNYERAEESDMRMVDSQQRTVRENEKFERLFPTCGLRECRLACCAACWSGCTSAWCLPPTPLRLSAHTIRENNGSSPVCSAN
jgi:phosphoenolpyruvate carboxylase